MFCFLNGNKEKTWPLKRLYLNVIVVLGIIVLGGVGSIYAIENDATGRTQITSVSFPNADQAQKAENLAKQAALQKQEVITAKENGVTEEADVLYNKAFDYYYDQITSMRANGMGWGDIAHAVGVHPSVLGSGHSKKAEDKNSFFTKMSRLGSTIKAAVTRGFKGDKAGGSGNFAAASKSSSKGKGHSFAIGSARGLSNGRGDGQSAGHGGGPGNGHGGGNGSGNGGGNK
jgi:hypothetical protein